MVMKRLKTHCYCRDAGSSLTKAPEKKNSKPTFNAVVEDDAWRLSIASGKEIKRSQERTRGLQLGSIPSTPIKAERARPGDLVCIENNPVGAEGATTRTWQKH